MNTECYNCDNLMEYPIKIVDIPAKHFSDTDNIYFEKGYKCTWNGRYSLNINDLPKKNCRCKKTG